jgi:hypothetical protein
MKKASLLTAAALAIFCLACEKKETSKEEKPPNSYAGIYEYYTGYDSQYIVLSEKDGKITGFYYGTSDEFDEVREGYDAGYFVAQMTDLKINGDAITFVLNVDNSDFLTDIIDLQIISTHEAIKAGNKNWGNYITTEPKEYVGHISADKETILIKGDKMWSDDKKFVKKEKVTREKPLPPEPPTEEQLRLEAIYSMIYQVMTGFHHKDEQRLNELLIEDFGIAYVNTPGIYTTLSISSKMPFVTELGWVSYNEISDSHMIDFDFKEFPIFSCGEEKWNKHGIYFDTTSFDYTLAGIAEMNNEQGIAEWSAKELEKFKELGKSSRTVMIVDDEERALKLILTLWKDKWYITAIIEVDSCG